MNPTSFFLSLAACLMLMMTAPVHAQDDAPPKPVVVNPDQFEIAEKPGVTARVVDTPQGRALQVTSENADQTIVLELGWLDVKPETAYLCQFQVQPVELEAAANAYMLVREHPKKGQRPIKPYHITSSRARSVDPQAKGKWVSRRESFTSTAETNQLSGSIILSSFKGTLLISGFEVQTQAAAKKKIEQAAWRDSEEMMADLRAQAEARKQLVPRTLVFSRSQMKYGLERFYDHVWIDRPLFTSRAYRVPFKHVTGLASYRRILQEVAQYDIDGLAFFPETHGRMGMFEVHTQANMPDIGLLPEFLPKLGNSDPFQPKVEILTRALANPACPRIDGKLLITSYAAQSFTPQQWQELLDRLRAEVGDKFIFLPTVTTVVGLMNDYNQGKPISPDEVARIQAKLREWLDHTDGLYFNYPAAFRLKDHTFNEGFYRDVFVPVFKSVLNEPAYRNKYLGLSAYKSHMNPDRSNSLHEDATRTLRHSFEVAMNAKPDVMILPEWDEFNENTCFRPTIYGSTTTQRIVRYYMSQIKNKQPTPLPDDDTTIPNFVLSARKIVTLGENSVIELLNIPDTTEAGSYAVQLLLHDEQGRLIKQFEPVTFDQTKLQEHRFHLDTTAYPNVRAYVPSIIVTGYRQQGESDQGKRYEGFHAINVRATWNWDFLFVKQPLRELVVPDEATFQWASASADASSDNALTLQASVKTDEPVAQVEVLADDDLVYAYDVNDEFHRADPSQQQIIIEYRSVKPVTIAGGISLENAQGQWIVKGAVLHQQAAEIDVDPNEVRLNAPASLHKRWVYVSLPTADIDQAILKFDFPQASFAVPVRDIFEKKMISRAFDQGLHFVMSPYRRQLDMPVHLNQTQASFNVKTWPEISTELYHLRVTTVSGKTWRSKPLRVPDAQSGDESQGAIIVHSEKADGAMALQVDASRVPVIDYEFDPSRGAVLLADAGRPFWATLGGYTESTTGRGTYASLLRNYPKEITHAAPQWTTDSQGRPALAFDGQGTFLILPRETIPANTGWSLHMEIKPEDGRDQVILINRILGYRQMGLALGIVNGKLEASFRSAGNRFAADLEVPPQKWSAIDVTYDLQTLTLAVDGKAVRFPLEGPANNIGFTIIGNDDRGRHFKGELRALRITHQSQSGE